jgi:acyl transferase domain-containing protein/NAD(P)-dependent dehydrogenase (short-subunit alcohol dehydrogenase family)/acyl carrier protein
MRQTQEHIQEPVAIIGIGCRFPGNSDSPEAFWEMIRSGADGYRDVPQDRWNVARFYSAQRDMPGTMYVKAGGFLQHDICDFDAMFFGISPREAEVLDPQQRLLLEVTWEALEDAGQVIADLAGSDTGVFIGGFMMDNQLTQFSQLNRNDIRQHTAVGSTLSILSNRISYAFDLRGPSISMDTACSSSLVALHQACEAIRSGDCSMALVGGVNVMHRPENLVAMCKGGFLSPDGRSKPFDARADGYGRGEGAGIVVLKPLRKAMADGDRIYAVIRGTGVNQDGRTDGITVPNRNAQEALIRSVCASAGVAPTDIVYAEAHGTGTPVGDPLEAGAIGAAIGHGRSSEDACALGSVKANIGHLEAAAGVAALIKTALCLHHGVVPPLANLGQPNPRIPFDALGLRLPRSAEPMPDRNGQRFACINSFGYGGTNAHAVLQAAPLNDATSASADDIKRPCLLPLSARSHAALLALAARYRTMFADTDAESLRDICQAAALRRDHHDHRAAFIADTPAALLQELDRYLEAQRQDEAVAVKPPPTRDNKPVFVFTGMGPQWWAMGRELLESEPVFREMAERCDALFHRHAGWSILEAMCASETDSRMAETQIAQPANFVLQVALAALWQAHGIEPAAIVGHSVGEVAAAYVSGALDLETAIRVVLHRSRVQKQAAGQGGMLAIEVSPERAESLLSEFGGQVSIAAANSPTSVTLAGDLPTLQRIEAAMQQEGTFARFLAVEVAYHSPFMDPLIPQLLDALHGIPLHSPVVPLYSTVTGGRVDGAIHDAAYWCRNMRDAVRFADAITALAEDGHRIFLEVGPHPVLSTSIQKTLAARAVDGLCFLSLQRKKPEQQTFRQALCALYAAGIALNWNTLHPHGGRFMRLPSYPWQRESLWHESAASARDRLGHPVHPLLGEPQPAPTPVWRNALNENLLPYLQDHVVDGLTVLPGAAYVEIGLAIHHAIAGEDTVVLRDLSFSAACSIDRNARPVTNVAWDSKTGHFSIHSLAADDSWTLHANGRISTLPPAAPTALTLAQAQARCLHSVAPTEHYRIMQARGLAYGPTFQGVRMLHLDATGTEVLARIEADPSTSTASNTPDMSDYRLHPALLDAAFQSLLATLAGTGDEALYVPVGIRELRLHKPAGNAFWCYGKRTGLENGGLEGELCLLDDDGEVIAELVGISARALTRSRTDTLAEADGWLYRFAWQAQPLDAPHVAGGLWLCWGDDEQSDRVANALHGTDPATALIRLQPGRSFARTDANTYVVDPTDAASIELAFKDACKNGNRLRGMLLFPAASSGSEDAVGMQSAQVTLAFIQAFGRSPHTEDARLIAVTQLLQSPDTNAASATLQAASSSGLVRVAVNEFPDRSFCLVDLDDDHGAFAMLAAECLADGDEDDLAFRGGVRYVHRLVRANRQSLVGLSGNNTLDAAIADGLTHLGPDASARAAALMRTELRCNSTEPAAVADIVVTHLGFVSDPAPTPSSTTGNRLRLGPAALGRALHTDNKACSLQLGNRVLIALDNGKPSTDLRMLIALPETIEASTAAALPFLAAAEHALCRLASLAPGEHVLIRDGDSVLGQAALQIALRRGARIHVCLRNPTVEHDDRVQALEVLTPQNAERLLSQIGAQGIDVVVDHGGDEVAERLAQALAPLGRFVCLRDDGRIAPLHIALPSNRQLITFDLGTWMRECPLVYTDALRAELDRAQTPSSAPLLLNGLLVAGMDPAVAGARVMPPSQWNAEDTCLITGGFGGFGLKLAHWLVARGCRHLVLVGRSGANTPEAQHALETFREMGVQVLPVAADIAQRLDVERCLREAALHMPPIRGIFHAAAVLDDGPIEHLKPEQLDRAMQPKAMGAWNLHTLTQHLPIDCFVLFSSIASLIGSPGQASYVAANTFLDALAALRRQAGLPAISINWGALAEVGMAARHEGVEQHLNRIGVGFFTPDKALALLQILLELNPSNAGAAQMDWQRWGDTYPGWAASSRYRHLFEEAVQMAGDGGEDGATSDFAQMDGAARLRAIRPAFAEVTSRVLKIRAEQVDPHQPLLSLGLDSLMALELQMAVQKRFGVKLSTLDLMKNQPVAELENQLATLLEAPAKPEQDSGKNSTAAGMPDSTSDKAPDPVLIQIEEMSEDALNTMLKQMLTARKDASDSVAIEEMEQ